jgi:hypothetical protein
MRHHLPRDANGGLTVAPDHVNAQQEGAPAQVQEARVATRPAEKETQEQASAVNLEMDDLQCWCWRGFGRCVVRTARGQRLCRACNMRHGNVQCRCGCLCCNDSEDKGHALTSTEKITSNKLPSMVVDEDSAKGDCQRVHAERRGVLGGHFGHSIQRQHDTVETDTTSDLSTTGSSSEAAKEHTSFIITHWNNQLSYDEPFEEARRRSEQDRKKNSFVERFLISLRGVQGLAARRGKKEQVIDMINKKKRTALHRVP